MSDILQGVGTVNVGLSTFADALRAQDAPVTYTRYRDADHGATWERAYESTITYDWLLQYSRSQRS